MGPVQRPKGNPILESLLNLKWLEPVFKHKKDFILIKSKVQ